MNEPKNAWMWRNQGLAGFLALLVGVAALPSGLEAQTTTRVSAAPEGGDPDGFSFLPVMSGDARYVGFSSNASNLVPGDNNQFSDVFVYDRQTKITTRVSVTPEGGDPNNDSLYAGLSSDGRFVVFESLASNLVMGDKNEARDVFVYDRETNATTRVSQNMEGEDHNGIIGTPPTISANGRYIAFDSTATNLGPGSESNVQKIFVYDQQTGSISQVSLTPEGGNPNNGSSLPAISADGRYVAFVSSATDLVAGDGNGVQDIFVYDRQEGTTTRASVTPVGDDPNGKSFFPALSAKGRYVAFSSNASNLVPGDDNEATDVFVYDRLLETTTRVGSTLVGEADVIFLGGAPALSADGRFVAFASKASDLVAGDVNEATDVFVYDQQMQTTSRLSVTPESGDPNGPSEAPTLSATGRYVTFESMASNLIEGDANGLEDIYVRDRGPAAVAEAGHPDVTGDGLADLVWRNTATGASAAWLMNGSALRQEATFPGGAALDWVVRGIGDVNRDGPADLVWRNMITGTSAIWLMNNEGQRQSATFPGGAELEWVIRGIGDVNGDGMADLIWRDTNSGATAVWLMNEEGQRQEVTFPGTTGLDWVIRQVGDINKDGSADLVWRNTNNGATAIWLLTPSGTGQEVTFPGGASLDWAIRGVRDVNGDGPADVVWHNTTTGATAVWLMNFSGLRQEATFPGGASLDWSLRGASDVNGDGQGDLIWRNTSNGATAMWVMNTSGLRESATFPGGASLEWELRP